MITVFSDSTGERVELKQGMRVRYSQILTYGFGTVVQIGRTDDGGDCIIRWDKSNTRAELSANLTAAKVTP